MASRGGSLCVLLVALSLGVAQGVVQLTCFPALINSCSPGSISTSSQKGWCITRSGDNATLTGCAPPTYLSGGLITDYKYPDLTAITGANRDVVLKFSFVATWLFNLRKGGTSINLYLDTRSALVTLPGNTRVNIQNCTIPCIQKLGAFLRWDTKTSTWQTWSYEGAGVSIFVSSGTLADYKSMWASPR